MLPKVPKGFITSEKTPAFKSSTASLRPNRPETKQILSEEERSKGFRPWKSITNFPGAVPDFIGPRQFIILLSVVGIFLLIIFSPVFDYWPFFYSRTLQKQQQILTTSTFFDNPSIQERFEELVTNGLLNSGDPSAKEDALKALSMLTAEYTENPTSEKREAIAILSESIKMKFGNEVSGADLSIPCREQACGAVFVYSDDLAEFRKSALESTIINDIEKKALDTGIQSAALAAGSGNKQLEYSSLSSVFFNLKSSWQRSKSEDTRQLALKALSILEKMDPQASKLGGELKNYQPDEE